MHIVILHCHFQRGGVTQVVENQVRFLAGCDQVDSVTLISGDRRDGLSTQTVAACQHIVIEEMEYDSLLLAADHLAKRAGALAKNISESLATLAISPDQSVLHWHNHSLGKNVAAPAAITILSNAGWRFLLQVHDFAEDNRPQNYAHVISSCTATSPQEVDAFLYPAALQTHYAALTQADLGVFAAMGIAQRQTHCLPNSVTKLADEATDRDEALYKVRQAFDLPDDARWCLYPVRGIRRKNVGEFLLLSRWLSENTFAGISLRPTTRIEALSYDRWKEVATKVAPRALFDAGQTSEVTFVQNIAATDFVISTSVAEGFGMVFLEPWLSQRNVIARQLPTVTTDFRENGIEFPLLYESIAIPGDRDWIQQCWAESCQASVQAWSRVPAGFRPSTTVNIDSSITAESIDFAMLTPTRQVNTLERLANDHGFELATQQLNAELCTQLRSQPDESLIARNAKRIGEIYSMDHQGANLVDAYQAVLRSPIDPTQSIAGRSRLAIDCVSAIRPMYPCRTEEFADV
ncbi:MAG: hypothetical protein WBD20_01050 [Pirellulaceae bacterium]